MKVAKLRVGSRIPQPSERAKGCSASEPSSAEDALALLDPKRRRAFLCSHVAFPYNRATTTQRYQQVSAGSLFAPCAQGRTSCTAGLIYE
jgi:hypothetical protein